MEEDTFVAPNFTLASERIPYTTPIDREISNLFTPGEFVTGEEGLLRGHGTYVDNGEIKSSLAGMREQVNKLIYVRSLKGRYSGEMGDVVIGRITEIQQKRWKVDVNGKVHATLLLSAVNLPGGELRRRSVEDEHMMRQYLSEGDLISAEVQNVSQSDGSLSLHTRNLKYGKLSQGVFIKVPPTLIRRTKTHFHNICGASCIIGTNGYIWIYPTPSEDGGAGGFARNLDLKVDPKDRENIARINCCIQALVACKMLVYDTSIVAAFEAAREFSTTDLLIPEVALQIGMATKVNMGVLE
uniref:Exosome complex component RRP4 n=2 Tax=Lygus hesperus TaxID=30085 RepID=A0A0A9YZ59_LYGHE